MRIDKRIELAGAMPGMRKEPAARAPFAPLRLFLFQWRGALRTMALMGGGMGVVVVLVCALPLYTALIANVQLRQTLAAAPALQRNLAAQITTSDPSPDALRRVEARVRELAGRDLGALVAASTPVVALHTLQPLYFKAVDGRRVADARPELQIDHTLPYAFEYAQAAPHMRLFAGRLPQDVPAGEPPEVLVTPKLLMKPGETLTVNPLFAPDQTVTMRVAGVWFPKDTADPFWNGADFDTFSTDGRLGLSKPAVYPLLFTTTAFEEAFASQNAGPGPGAITTVGAAVMLLYTPDTSGIDTASLQSTADGLASLRAHLAGDLRGTDGVVTATLETGLGGLFASLQTQLALLGLPLGMVVAQTVGLALIFVLLMAALLADWQGEALAVLKGRGAGDGQVLAAFALPGVTLAALLAAAGPLLGSALARLLLRLFVPGAGELNPAVVARVAAPGAAVGAAAAGGALCAVAVVAALARAARLDVLAFRRAQGRGGGVPLWRRYHLDLALAGLCAAGYLELGQFGGLSVRAALGQNGTNGGTRAPDPLLLATPALLLLAGGLIVPRLFPLGARLAAGLMLRGRRAAGMLALAHVARVPAEFTRLTLLLTLSVGLGLFALVFNASLGQNAADHAAYATGGDVRVTLADGLGGTGNAVALGSQLAALPGVRAVAPFTRARANIADDAGNYVIALDVLGFDPASFARVAHWRADYADQPLAALLAGMRAHAAGATAGQRQTPIWALVSDGLAAARGLAPGDRFVVVPQQGSGANVSFVVGAIVHALPTLYAAQSAGYIAVNEADLLTALNTISFAQADGPTEYWLATTGTAGDDARRAAAVAAAGVAGVSLSDRRALEAQERADALNAGMGGLLLIGAALAALLAAVGSLAQGGLSARRQRTEFAVLRALGMSRTQLRTLQLGQQMVVCLFGLVGGSLLGLALATATLPFLQFSGALVDPATLGVPPYTLTFDGERVAVFYAALLGALAAALLLGMRLATRAGVGETLRLGKD